MAPRRTHTKSRNGCQSCKARKVKCDEARPQCNNCIKHGSDCVFLSVEHVVTSPTPTPPATSSMPIPYVSDATGLTADNGTPAMGMAEMALLHHFSTSTCYTISRHPVLQTLWQITVPQFGFSYQFVFRAILALSALHLAHIKPDLHAQYVAAAEFHHNIALHMVSGTIPQINEENGPAVYLFSTITCIIECAMPRKREDFWISNDKVLQWLRMFRGTVAIIISVNEALRKGPLAPMFTLGDRKYSSWHARSSSQRPLADLQRLIRETVKDPNELKYYEDAIDSLGKSFATVAEHGPQNCETADIFIWLTRLSDDYLEFLQRKTPESLVIFAYFAVITKELEWTWWMQGFSVHLIRAIYHHLDEEYRYWLQWPMQQLGWVP